MATGIIWPDPDVEVQKVVSKPLPWPAALSRALAFSGASE